MSVIFIDGNTGNLGNQIFPIFQALSFYKKYPSVFDRIYFKNYYTDPLSLRIDQSIIDNLFSLEDISKIISFDAPEFDHIWNLRNNSKKEKTVNLYDLNLPKDFDESCDLFITGYCQNYRKIDSDSIQSCLKINSDLLEEINNYYGDLSDIVCLHIRRGDYLLDTNKSYGYITYPENFIINLCNKYSEGRKILCVSDDIGWCKKSLRIIPNIIFADKHKSNDIINTKTICLDLIIPSLCYRNLTSPSSFCVASCLLNPRKDMVICDPYYFNEKWNNNSELQITPPWAKKESILNYSTP